MPNWCEGGAKGRGGSLELSDLVHLTSASSAPVVVPERADLSRRWASPNWYPPRWKFSLLLGPSQATPMDPPGFSNYTYGYIGDRQTVFLGQLFLAAGAGSTYTSHFMTGVLTELHYPSSH